MSAWEGDPTDTSQGGRRRRATTGRARLRILVIDDEPMMLGTITRMLRNRHDVTALGDATAAFELLRTDHFDVVLSDLHMPRLNAAQLHECLVRDGNAHADRMLLMTGGAMSPESSAFVERMAGRVLEKPFTVQALLAIVQQFAAAPS